MTDEPELPPAERERTRHRDRKRQTRMVVDNAGVKRVLQSLDERRRRELEQRRDDPAQRRDADD